MAVSRDVISLVPRHLVQGLGEAMVDRLVVSKRFDADYF
jgi:hypothetical protein